MPSERPPLLPEHPDLLQPQTLEDDVYRLLRRGNVDGAQQVIKSGLKKREEFRGEAKNAMVFLLREGDPRTCDRIGKEFNVSDEERKDIWLEVADAMVENREIETLIALLNASEEICNWLFLDTERKENFLKEVQKRMKEINEKIAEEKDDEVKKVQIVRVASCRNFLKKYNN